MYTNIIASPDLHRIRWFALDNDKSLAVPPTVLMDTLRLLMKNSVFKFDHKYWLHKEGTAMGVPPDPP